MQHKNEKELDVMTWFKKWGMRVSVFSLCVILFASYSVTAFASDESGKSSEGNADLSNVGTPKDLKIKIDSKYFSLSELQQRYKTVSASLDSYSNSKSTTELKDDQNITEKISGSKVYKINVNDLNKRRIFTVSDVPLKVLISSPSLPGLVDYDSGFFRIGIKASFNFLPGQDYQLIVVTQGGVDANVNIGMTQSSDSSWITYSSYDLEQKNIILPGNTDLYDIGFTTSGTYKITVSTQTEMVVAGVNTHYGSNESVLLNNSSHSFIVNGQPTGSIADYKVIVSNVHSSYGGPYSVKIEKIN